MYILQVYKAVCACYCMTIIQMPTVPKFVISVHVFANDKQNMIWMFLWRAPPSRRVSTAGKSGAETFSPTLPEFLLNYDLSIGKSIFDEKAKNLCP